MVMCQCKPLVSWHLSLAKHAKWLRGRLVFIVHQKMYSRAVIKSWTCKEGTVGRCPTSAFEQKMYVSSHTQTRNRQVVHCPLKLWNLPRSLRWPALHRTTANPGVLVVQAWTLWRGGGTSSKKTFCCILGPHWAILGAMLGHFEAIWPTSWANLGASWPNLSHHEPSWALLGLLGAILGPY